MPRAYGVGHFLNPVQILITFPFIPVTIELSK